MGRRLHVSGGILGALFPKRRVIIIVLRDELVSHNIDKWVRMVFTFSNAFVVEDVPRVMTM
jgi:hypothetical protein